MSEPGAAPAREEAPAQEPVPSPAERPGTLSSIGIPQGLIVDADAHEVAGAVRRGGAIVPLEQLEYETWLLLLTPLSDGGLAKSALGKSSRSAAIIERLLDLGLLVRNDPEQGVRPEMARLRPIPLGIGLGNRNGDPGRFALQNASLSLAAPLSLDPIGTALWWNFDGAVQLGVAVDAVAASVEQLPRIAVECAAAVLVRDLMTHRLLYLDAAAPTQRRR